MNMDERKRAKSSLEELNSEFNLEELEAISMERIEEKYAVEDKMLKAVTEGNSEAAMALMEQFQTFPNTRYTANVTLQSAVVALTTLNTLFRKAVQDAFVHPAHIDHVSSKFAQRILSAKCQEELTPIPSEMIRKYCLLVRSYSLKGYSALTQQALNYIDFNLSEDLSLAYIADKLNVNKKYLSSHFRKEMGETITNYINKKRIRESLKYLGASDLAISDVALRVGMYDLNYYSRVFKQIIGMTPSQYRNMMREK